MGGMGGALAAFGSPLVKHTLSVFDTLLPNNVLASKLKERGGKGARLEEDAHSLQFRYRLHIFSCELGSGLLDSH